VPGMKLHVGVEAKLHAFFILALGGGDGHLQLWPLYSRGHIARYPINNRMGELQILSSPFTEEKKPLPFAANRKNGFSLQLYWTQFWVCRTRVHKEV